MKKWLPAVFLFAIVGGLLLWATCGEPNISRHREVTPEELLLRAETVLGPTPAPREWSAKDLFAPNLSALGDKAREVAAAMPGDHSIYDAEPFSASNVQEIERALRSNDGAGEEALLARARLHCVVVQAWFALGVPESALARAFVANEETANAVATAQTLEQWKEAQAARLYFLETLRLIARVEGWGRRSRETLQLLAAQIGKTGHRAALGRVLQRRVIEYVLPSIASASGAESLTDTASKALVESPDEETRLLVSRLLHRHPRAFSPEQTADAVAGAVDELLGALSGPWPAVQEILDKVSAAHSPWTGFLDLLSSDDESQVERIMGIKAAIDSTENPVGLALLQSERTGWSSLVQAAYVADAQEAVLRLELLRMCGEEGEVVDPLTGEGFVIEGSAVRSRLSGVGDAYPFVKSFAETGVRLL